MNEDLFKIQKQDVTYDNTYEENGITYGTCNGCNQENVNVDDHYCISIVDDKKTKKYSDFKEQYLENNIVNYNDGQINYIKKLFDTLHTKYRTNTFFKSLYDKAINTKKLTQKQHDNLFFLLKNGKSMYDAGILTTKN